MGGLVAIIIQALVGAASGSVAGNILKTGAMALAPKLIAGAVGGVAGGSLLGSLFGVGTVADPNAAAGISVATLVMQVIGAVLGGGGVAAIAGKVMGGK